MKSSIKSFIALVFIITLGNCLQVCLDNKPGFTATYQTVSYNGIPYEGAPPTSFAENAGVSVDYKGQRLAVDYEMITNGAYIYGSMYLYGENSHPLSPSYFKFTQQTQYMVSEEGNECQLLPLTFPIPNGFPTTNITDGGYLNLGSKFIVHSYQIKGNSTTQTVFLDEEKCSVATIGAKNNDGSGFSTTNYYNYESYYDDGYFLLPSICWNVTFPSGSDSSSSTSNIKIQNNKINNHKLNTENTLKPSVPLSLYNILFTQPKK
ncbi:hypothetical protein DLAC_04845 [Tieghemostelium lacteum]|uniref:Uncharacterized protein n=1 Tax=Tieghemostelium lacteum TaxID=361077 RepID=A0A151ZJ69_TIELA|nr:hypothetical protein DLAC_04845 [Tieghemostelium lacteum]|eukprot:KYQ93955.1 hypothetical protein DLAC_04845 [Tieghemostelium lacteum]